jgi:tetratricopeptide (TPR) repeat protein
MDIHQQQFIEQAKQGNGGTMPENIDSLTKETMLNLQIDLISTCTVFFQFTDSLMKKELEKTEQLDKDSLHHLLLRSDTLKKKNAEYYGLRATFFYNLGQYESSLFNINKVLAEEPNNTKAIFVKGRLLDLMGNYSEAVVYYDRLVTLSHNRAFFIYSAMAKRKAKENLRPAAPLK